MLDMACFFIFRAEEIIESYVLALSYYHPIFFFYA